jgi:putative transposase
MPDHVHMLLAIPPKYSVAQVVGFIKVKSAIHIARSFSGHKRNFTGQHFWARGIMCPPLAKMKKLLATTSKHRKQET